MEQVITTAIAQARTSLQEQSALSTNLEQKVLSLRENYQSFENFASDFNPNSQVDFGSDVRGTIMNDYSTLEMLDMAFGDGSASAWLVTSLADLNKFSGSKNMDDGQTKWLAKLLFQEYKNVKYSVMQLFFYRFKVGDFGKFWGKVDPMVITCALKDFMVECENMRQQFLNEEYDRRKAEEDTIRKVLREKWDSCFSDLWKSSPDDDSKRVFQSIGFINYDKESNLLLLKVRREEFELIEGKYLSIFSAVIKKHYPRVKVQYFLPRESVITLEAPSNKKNDYPAHQQREVQQGIISAHAIIANKFGLDSKLVDDMRYSFKLRYKREPEEYLKINEKHQAFDSCLGIPDKNQGI